MNYPKVCPTCDTPALGWLQLPDGTMFCPACRNLVPAVVEVPEPHPGKLLPSDDWVDATSEPINEDDAETVTHESSPPVVEPSVPVPDSDTSAVVAAPADVSPPSPETNGAAPAIDSPPGDGPNVTLLRMLIGLTLRAGAMSVGDNNEPIEPPTGWMPPPFDTMPEIAGAAALAVATLIFTCEIQVSDVIALANSFLEDPNDKEEV